MAGTVEGGRASAKTNKRKYGADFYIKLNKLSQESWERNGRKPRGFAAMTPAKLRAVGKKGGKRGRGKTKTRNRLEDIKLKERG